MTAVAVPLIRCVTCRSCRVRQISYHSSREARQQKRGEGGVEVQGKQAQERPMVSLVHFPICAMLVMYGI